VATTAVDTVEVSGHEVARATLGALLAELLDLAGVIDLVVLEDPENNNEMQIRVRMENERPYIRLL